jgi:hypothetical protein
MMNEQNHVLEIPHLLSNRIGKRLIFETEGLTIEKPFSFDPTVFIPAENMAALRMGVKWIRGMRFVLGRRYVIEIKHTNDSITKLNLHSYYGLRVQNYEEAWSDTISHLYSFYFSGQLNMYMELFQLGQSFDLLGVTFHANGISWGQNGILPWNQITTSNYRTYFVIHHKQNARINKSFNFLNDWNAHILQAMLKYVGEEHKKMFSK